MNEQTLKDQVKEKFNPFVEQIVGNHENKIHSIHITGSALTQDFNPKTSDINSVFVLHKMDLQFLEDFAPLGIKYGKKRVSAPLIMTPDYIKGSLDVFPIEFLNIKILHYTVFGEDIFDDLEINPSDLRHQCERELKVKLIGLRQGYLSSSGNAKILTEGFMNTIAGYIPLFRGIIVLYDQQAPKDYNKVLTTLQEMSGVNTAVFRTVLNLKKERKKFSIQKLNTLFEDYYRAIEKLGDLVDAIKV
jgi:hypothetical protein